MADIKLSDSSVTSSAIVLQGAEANWALTLYVEEQPAPGKLAATDAQSEVMFNGWSNPLISIRGYLDESADALANSIDFSLLKSFAKSTGSTYLIDDVYGTLKIKLREVNVRRVAPTDKISQVYEYSIRAIETL